MVLCPYRFLVALPNLFLFFCDTHLHFLQDCFNNPKPVVPAVEIALVHLQHFVAKHQLTLKNCGFRVVLSYLCFVVQTNLDGPLSLKPQCIAFWTFHYCLYQKLQFCSDKLQLLFLCIYFVLKQMQHDFSAVVPECLEIWAQERKFLCLLQSFKGVLLISSLLEQNLIIFGYFL